MTFKPQRKALNRGLSTGVQKALSDNFYCFPLLLVRYLPGSEFFIHLTFLSSLSVLLRVSHSVSAVKITVLEDSANVWVLDDTNAAPG